ncbi:MAG: DUF1272 domain-containing protein [Thermoplasmata archaeon]
MPMSYSRTAVHVPWESSSGRTRARCSSVSGGERKRRGGRPDLPPPPAKAGPGNRDPGDQSSIGERRRRCERYSTELGTLSEAYVCSLECTFRGLCADAMGRLCPNCQGELHRRPTAALR